MKTTTYIKLFFFLLLFFGIERLYHRATDGFALMNIYGPKRDYSKYQTDLSLNLSTINLDQPFYYFNSGSQSYIFLSEDGQTILKFFKFQHMRIPFFINYLPLPNFLDKKRDLKKEKKRKVLENTMNSYQIAFEYLHEETALLYTHLAPSSHLNKKVVIFDKIGKKHVIDLDRVQFILQKKANLVYETIDKWMKNGEKAKAKEGIHHLLQLTLSRCQKGIFDKDPDFSTNFGFINNIPIQIDVGRFSLDPSEKNPDIYQNEIFRISRNFQKWIEKNHPDLLDFFNEEIEKIYE